jgi:hypothetical protein
MTPLCARPSTVVQRGAVMAAGVLKDVGSSRNCGAVVGLTAQAVAVLVAGLVPPPAVAHASRVAPLVLLLLLSWLPPLPQELLGCEGKRCVGAALGGGRHDVGAAADVEPGVHTAINSESSELTSSTSITSTGDAGATVAEQRPGMSLICGCALLRLGKRRSVLASVSRYSWQRTEYCGADGDRSGSIRAQIIILKVDITTGRLSV